MPAPTPDANTTVLTQPNTPSQGTTSIDVTVRDPVTGQVVSEEHREGPNGPPDPWDNYTERWRDDYSKGEPQTLVRVTEIGVTHRGHEKRVERTSIKVKKIVKARRPLVKQIEDVSEIVIDSEGARWEIVTGTWVDGSKKDGYSIGLNPPGLPVPRYWPHPRIPV